MSGLPLSRLVLTSLADAQGLRLGGRYPSAQVGTTLDSTLDDSRAVTAYVVAGPLLGSVGVATALADVGARARQAFPGVPSLPSVTAAAQGVEKMPGAVLLVVAGLALAYLIASSRPTGSPAPS
jgi:hypothetical protein